MSLSAEIRQQVRRRAAGACEYCGVTETETAGLLTVDHFHPQSRGGSDDISNLVYCCHACNGFKSDYWPIAVDAPHLWNPRQEPASAHLLEMADGTLLASTSTGTFSVNRLRLNRPLLLANRQQRKQRQDLESLLKRLSDLTALLDQIETQKARLLAENTTLLQEKRRLLKFLLRGREET